MICFQFCTFSIRSQSFSDICKVILIRTEYWGDENSYSIGSCGAKQEYSDSSQYSEECCLVPGTYTMDCKDSYGDGWHGGYLKIHGVKYCDDFKNGHKQTVTIEWGL